MNYIEEFLKEHPIYEKIRFHSMTNPDEAKLHPIFSASQAVIDSMRAAGQNRIAIILPDDDLSIIPLLISKYISNIQELSEYTHSVFEEIQPGQHLKLGKAVVEFISFDKTTQRIKLLIGKPTKKRYGNTIYIEEPTTLDTPFKNYHLYFERSNGRITKYDTFTEEKTRIDNNLKANAIADIDLLATKRTLLRKTVIVLSSKKAFTDSIDNLYVSGRKAQDVITYGEFDDTAEQGTRLFNAGQLDCLPGLIVSARIGEVSTSVTSEKMKDQVEAIVIAQSIRSQTFIHTSASDAEIYLLNTKKSKPKTGTGTPMSMICRKQMLRRMSAENLVKC